jgi:hypothetical protein
MIAQIYRITVLSVNRHISLVPSEIVESVHAKAILAVSTSGIKKLTNSIPTMKIKNAKKI